MKKIFMYQYVEIIFYFFIFIINFLFTLIMFSLKLSTTSLSLWSSIGSKAMNNHPGASSAMGLEGYISIVLIVLFLIGLALSIASLLLHCLKKNKQVYYVSIPYEIILNLIVLVLQLALKIFSTGTTVLSILNILLMMATFIFFLYGRGVAQDKDKTAEESKRDKVYKNILLAIECISMGIVLLLFFIPLFTLKNSDGIIQYTLIQALGKNNYASYISILFILVFLLIFGSFLYFTSTISYYFRKDKTFVVYSKASIYGNLAITLICFLIGYFVCFYNKTKNVEATTLSHIPFILSLILLIVYSIFHGKLGSDIELKKEDKSKKLKFEPLIYIMILTIFSFLSLVFNVIEIHIKLSSVITKDTVLNGYKLLTTYNNLSGGFQVLAFLLFSFLLISGVLFVLTLSSFFAKYKDYYKVVKLTTIANVIFMLLLGLFSIYYRIAQKINEDAIASILEASNLNFNTNYTYTITSQTIYIFIMDFVILLVMIFRGQLNHHIPEESILKLSKDSALPSTGANGNGPLEVGSVQIDFDACPAFTELDSKIEEYKNQLEHRQNNLFENITLPNLVRFIVDYARECRLHLSYSLEDIATFVAGLGASRLTILQGMSGTGKTSLPKIFAEAIMGNCEIIEVESSWRDKNELLGYYNEFSKCFTPKKFTQCLYKAGLNPSVPTFIVLDEMNLSRIEYYFSDFLSLMENEEDKREIKLLNIKLARIVNEEAHEYYGLTEGHTIKIPTNVWFIGTANRDESTFEISDKVYDRAQTMNFNKRAPKIHSFSQPLSQRFASYDQIAQLFEEAKNNNTFDAEENKIINKVEKLLAPYNISFGNRILKQMEDFVKIYCACFGDKDAVVDNAVEKILLSKVVSKLEYKIVENKEALALEFDKLGLSLCSQFVRKLNED